MPPPPPLPPPVVQVVVALGAVQVTTALLAPPTVVVVIVEGQVMDTVLATLAVTVTWKEQVVVLPQPSVALYVTVEVPIGKLPPFGIPLVNVAVAVPVVQSVVGTGAVHVATALLAPTAAVNDMFAGQAILILLETAVTITLKEQVVVLPQPSVAV